MLMINRDQIIDPAMIGANSIRFNNKIFMNSELLIL
jgi:hypothetical protein